MKTSKTGLFVIALVLSLCLPLASGCQQTETWTPSESSGPDLVSIPLEQVLSSGQPTIAEFGRGICVPCKAMKPILEELAVEYEGKLNVVIVEIDDHMDQTREYEIMAIPTQIFFDSSGQEITRHVGFYAKEDVVTQLKEMGIE